MSKSAAPKSMFERNIDFKMEETTNSYVACRALSIRARDVNTKNMMVEKESGLVHQNLVGVKGGFTRANSLECAVRCETREEDAAGRAAAAVGRPPGGSAFRLRTQPAVASHSFAPKTRKSGK